MNSVTLTLKSSPPQRIDASTLLPEHLSSLSQPQIEEILLPMGRRTTRLDEWFDVQCKTTSDVQDELHLVGDCRQLDCVAQAMSRGSLSIDGAVGDALGHRLRGGVVRVCGDAGNFAAMSMRGGRLIIEGNVGDHAAGPARGERSGMSGGELIVGGSAGNHLAYRLRRGTLLVMQNIGDHAAAEMVAGTLSVGGTVGNHLAIGMRRGTLWLNEAPSLPKTGFTTPRPETPSSHPLLIKHLHRLARLVARPADSASGDSASDDSACVMRAIGDRAVGGMGEVLWRA